MHNRKGTCRLQEALVRPVECYYTWGEAMGLFFMCELRSNSLFPAVVLFVAFILAGPSRLIFHPQPLQEDPRASDDQRLFKESIRLKG